MGRSFLDCILIQLLARRRRHQTLISDSKRNFPLVSNDYEGRINTDLLVQSFAAPCPWGAGSSNFGGKGLYFLKVTVSPTNWWRFGYNIRIIIFNGHKSSISAGFFWHGFQNHFWVTLEASKRSETMRNRKYAQFHIFPMINIFSSSSDKKVGSFWKNIFEKMGKFSISSIGNLIFPIEILIFFNKINTFFIVENQNFQ